MNLIVEQGNTHLKVALFDEKKIVASFFGNGDAYAQIEKIFETYRPTQGIWSSVAGADDVLINDLQARLSYFLRFNAATPVPVVIRYETRETLGLDRIAAVVGALEKQAGKNILIIDAGTAITYEVIEASGTYIGGNISPGMTSRFRSLNLFTQQLTLLTEKEEVPLIGTCTESAILAGVVNGIVYEMDGYIETLKEKYGRIFVFLTGGNSIYFEKRLKSHIFADANLVLYGLNRILEYNANKN